MTDQNYFEKNQIIAIETQDRPVLVLAPAGTGKTAILTEKFRKIANKNGISSIVAISFTKKSASELRSRVQENSTTSLALTEKEARQAYIGTFHSIGMRLLREASQKDIYEGPCMLADENAQMLCVSIALRKMQSMTLSDHMISLQGKERAQVTRRLLQVVSKMKNAGWIPIEKGYKDAYGMIVPIVTGQEMPGSKDHILAVLYQEALTENKLLDYDDIILKTTNLLNKYKAILLPDLKCVIIDEYQDVNNGQEDYINALSKDIHLTCAGDDDQALYGWRGARIDNILEFGQRRPTASIVELTRNYRSVPGIVEQAQQLIKNNLVRHEKTGTSSRTHSNENCVQFHDITQITRAARSTIDLLKKKYLPESAAILCERFLAKKVSSSNIGIVCRTNAEAEAIVKALEDIRIPARISNPNGITSKELIQLTAWIKAMVNPSDVTAAAVLTESTANDASYLDITTAANIGGIPVLDYIAELNRSKKLKQTRFSDAGHFYESFTEIYNNEGNSVLLDRICHHVSKSKHSKTSDIQIRYFWNVYRQLIIEIQEGGDLVSCIDILQNQIITDDMWLESSEPPIEVSTVHSMKGRQKNIIIISGFIDGVMPMGFATRNTAKDNELREERCLAYVAMTRARDEVHILSSSSHSSIFAAEAALAVK